MSRSAIRPTAAIITGLLSGIALTILTDAVLEGTGIIPHGPLHNTKLQIIELTYRGVYLVIGGYVAARLTTASARKAALIVGGVNCILSFVGAIATQHKGFAPMWYSLTLVVIAIPLAWFGGSIVISSRSKLNKG